MSDDRKIGENISVLKLLHEGFHKWGRFSNQPFLRYRLETLKQEHFLDLVCSGN